MIILIVSFIFILIIAGISTYFILKKLNSDKNTPKSNTPKSNTPKSNNNTNNTNNNNSLNSYQPTPLQSNTQTIGSKVIQLSQNISESESNGFLRHWYINHNSGNCTATQGTNTSCLLNSSNIQNIFINTNTGFKINWERGTGGVPSNLSSSNYNSLEPIGHNLQSWYGFNQGVIAYKISHMPVCVYNNKSLVWNALWIYGNTYGGSPPPNNPAEWPCFGEIDILEGLGDGFAPLDTMAPGTNKVTLHSVKCGDTIGGVGMNNYCQYPLTTESDAISSVGKGANVITISDAFKNMITNSNGKYGTMGSRFNLLCKDLNDSALFLGAVQSDGIYVGFWLPKNPNIDKIMNMGGSSTSNSSTAPSFNSTSTYGADFLVFFPPEITGQFDNSVDCNSSACSNCNSKLSNNPGWQQLNGMITSTIPKWGLEQANITAPLNTNEIDMSELYWEFSSIKLWVTEYSPN